MFRVVGNRGVPVGAVDKYYFLGTEDGFEKPSGVVEGVTREIQARIKALVVDKCRARQKHKQQPTGYCRVNILRQVP